MCLVYLSVGFSTASAYLLDFALVAIMTSQYYKNNLLDQLHNLRQDHMSVQDYIAAFEDLTRRNNMREHRFQTITTFVWGLRPKIRRVMITGYYDLDTVAF